MAIILIIIQIIAAIPSIIKLVMLIIGLINRLPKTERKAAYGRLKDICLKAKRHKANGLGMDAPVAELNQLLTELQARAK